MENENEQARLERTYSEKGDLELAELALDAGNLTDVARGVLASELERRGLDASPVRAHVADGEMREAGSSKISGPLVMVRRFRDLPEAFVAKSILDSAEIDSFLADENMIRIDWFISNLLGGVKLMVRPEDAESAATLLDEAVNAPMLPETETGEKSE
jgi:hypothetical protein